METVRKLADEMLDVLIEHDPLNELLQGFPRGAGRLGDPAESADDHVRQRAQRIAKEARALEASGDDAVTRGVILAAAEGVLARVDSRLVEHTVHDMVVSPLGKLLELLPQLHPANAEQEPDVLGRIGAVPDFLAAVAERHRAGVAAGRAPVARHVREAIRHLDEYLAAPQDDPFARIPMSATHERDRLLTEHVRPAFSAYRKVLAELEPHARPDDRPGLCFLPGGEATYAALVRMHTTTERTPEELHQTGLEALARLDEEYAELGARVFGVSDAAEVRRRMRTDPALRWSSREEMIEAAKAAVGRAEAAAQQWFRRRPQRRCQVKPTPPEQESTAPGAYYNPASLDGSRPGVYFVNTYQAEERPRCLVEAVAFHESVPGHHFQVSLAQELTDVPELRKVADFNAFIEGWGLYAERLADELGLYSDDLARLGMLANDSTRAARLVVDTGLHAFGWSRQQVVDFLRERTAMPEVEVQTETDRYIEAPGQALSYLVGRLELERLRARAEQHPDFDLRAFHDLVLGGGALPLRMLDEVVASWSLRG